MKTFLVLICTVALACAAGGAQEKNKSKKPAQKKSQAQSTQHAAVAGGGPQKTKGSQHGTKIGGTPVSGGGQKTKGKTKGSQYTAASGGYSAPSGAQKTKKAKGSQQVTTAGAGAQKTKKAKGSQQIATQGGQAVGGGHQKAKGSQQVVAAGKYTGSSTYSKKTKQWKSNTASAAAFQANGKKYKTQRFNLASNTRPTKFAAVTFQQNRHIQGSQNWQGENYWAFRNYRPVWHERNWWNNHYNRVVSIYGGWYYWNAGWWYPAWGYDSNAYYAYDGPIYAYNDLPPDQVIANVQAALQQQGYYQGEVDGLLGPLTRAAVANYQRDHGLYITSAIDRPTLSSLGMT
jgi:Putative peptidoglycan binding domain